MHVCVVHWYFFPLCLNTGLRHQLTQCVYPRDACFSSVHPNDDKLRCRPDPPGPHGPLVDNIYHCPTIGVGLNLTHQRRAHPAAHVQMSNDICFLCLNPGLRHLPAQCIHLCDVHSSHFTQTMTNYNVVSQHILGLIASPVWS